MALLIWPLFLEGKYMKYSLPLAATALLAVPAIALANGAKDEQTEAKDPDKITCKYTKVVGSRIPTRICLTNFEWEDRRRAQMEAKRSSLNRNSVCSNESGPC